MSIARKWTGYGLMVLASLMASSAFAATPANTRLTATAKLTYTGNTAGVTSSVTVSIQLAPSAPIIAATYSAPNNSVNKAQHQSYTGSYTIQTTANGPDTYDVAAAYTSTGTVTSPATPTTSVSTITLGATAAEVASTGATITVPSDGAADSSVNGIQTGDSVIVNGGKYTVASIVDNASGTSTITLNSSVTVAVGDGIYEYTTFTTDISDVGSSGGATDTLALLTTVTSQTDTSKKFSYTVDINILQITVTKYVRDVTTPCTTGCTGAIVDPYNSAVTYYSAGVHAQPADTLEYFIVVAVAAGTSISDGSAVLSDQLPAFTKYVAQSTKLNNIAVYDGTSAPIFPLDSSASNGGLLVDDQATRTVGTEGSGNIGSGGKAYVSYQVTVD